MHDPLQKLPPKPLVSVTSTIFGSNPLFSAMDTGDSYTCVVSSARAYCWGLGTKGQIGNGASADALTPTQVNINDVSSALYIDPSQATVTTAPVIKAIF